MIGKYLAIIDCQAMAVEDTVVWWAILEREETEIVRKKARQTVSGLNCGSISVLLVDKRLTGYYTLRLSSTPGRRKFGEENVNFDAIAWGIRVI